MITFRAARVLLSAAFLTLAACSVEQQDWRAAEAAGTIEAYGQFIEQHPGSELATQARARVAELSEERDWKEASRIATVEAYRQFLARHADGKWSQEARIRIESFALGSLPRIDPQRPLEPGSHPSGVRMLQLASAAPLASAAAPAGAASVPVEPASAAVPAAMASAGVSAGGSVSPAGSGSAGAGSAPYGVQLGAFGSPAGADREWQRLQARFGEQLSGLSPRVVAADTGAGELYRLQASAGGEAQARAICDSLRAQSQACVPVLPH